MTEADRVQTPYQRKKAARKARKQSERSAHRNLDDTTGQAIAEALRLAPEVASARTSVESERVIEVDLQSESEANFIRKRVNDALSIGEWLDEVAVWVWQAEVHNRAPLSEAGRTRGLELRLERAVGYTGPG